MRSLLLLLAAAAASSSTASSASALTYIPASDPSVLKSGRYQDNGDGSVTFDWAGTSFYISVQGATFLAVNASAGESSKVHTFIDKTLGSTVYVSGGNPSLYTLVTGLDAYGGSSSTHSLQVYNSLEPCKMVGGAAVTFHGFQTDGTVVATAPLTRKIEVLGDSITSASGGVATFTPCVESALTTDHASGYVSYLSAALSANTSTVSWSGKGLYKNCCPSNDNRTMRDYWRQTLGSDPAGSATWDFTRFVPDAFLLALGTNDMNNNNNPNQPGFQANLTATYVSFFQEVVATYRPSQPVGSLPLFALVGPITADYLPALSNATDELTAQGYNVTIINTMGAPCDGCNGHPGRGGHLAMAATALPIIQKVMGW
jgi:hypothetical protein